MSSRTGRDRRRREHERAQQRIADHVLAEHGLDIRCPHCGRPRSVGELREWEEDTLRAGSHPFVGAIRSMRIDYPQDALIGYCRDCGCFAAVEEVDHVHGASGSS